jgi:hypothetical protein
VDTRNLAQVGSPAGEILFEDIGEVPFRGCRVIVKAVGAYVSGVVQLTVPSAIIAGACSGIALEARSRSVVGGVCDRGRRGRNGFSVATRSVGARRLGAVESTGGARP